MADDKGSPRSQFNWSMRRKHSLRARTVGLQSIRCLRRLPHVLKRTMGEWKAPLSLRVRRDLRAALEEFAARDKRTLGNLGEVLLEWSFQQLQVVGSTERLLKYKVRSPDRHPKRP